MISTAKSSAFKASKPSISAESKSYLILNKPADWVVNDASTVKHDRVIQKWIEENYSFEISKSFEFRNGIVHRLDKETSGALIIAKTKKAFEEIQSQFKERLVHKKYIALLHGRLKHLSGEINVNIGRLPWRRDRFGVFQGGRDSQTFFKLEKEYLKEKEVLSLVEFKPVTGRTHQIRVHSKFLGNPIVGDEFYAGRKTSRKDRKWCPRLFLHAKHVSFIDPDTKKRVEYQVNLAQDLQAVLDSLQSI